MPMYGPAGVSQSDLNAAVAASQASIQTQIAASSSATLSAAQALIPAVPTPASAAPPGIGVSGSAGTQTTQYAMANHTHASSVQRQKIAFPASGGTITWNFPNAYATNATPIALAMVENAAGAPLPYVVNLQGPASNAAATFLVYKAQPTTLGATLAALLNAVISPFVNSAPQGLVLDCWAALPTS